VIFAEPPSTWPHPAPESTLHALLLLGVLPAAIAGVIVLLVIAPSIARGPRYRPGLSWWAPPEWIGGPSNGLAALDAGEEPQRAIGAGADASDDNAGGGASASW
jgi:hypothetical protein